MKKEVALISLVLVTVGCGSAKVNIQSNPPKAKVTVRPLTGGASKTIGETPLSLDASRISADANGQKTVYFTFEKEGYQPSELLVTDISQFDLNISKELKEKEKVSVAEIADFGANNKVIDKLFEAQRLVRVGRYDEALEQLNKLKEQSSNTAAIYEIIGGIHFLKKNYNDALDSYRLALKLNPTNAESYQMQKILEENLGIKKESSASGEILKAKGEEVKAQEKIRVEGDKTQ